MLHYGKCGRNGSELGVWIRRTVKDRRGLTRTGCSLKLASGLMLCFVLAKAVMNRWPALSQPHALVALL